MVITIVVVIDMLGNGITSNRMLGQMALSIISWKKGSTCDINKDLFRVSGLIIEGNKT